MVSSTADAYFSDPRTGPSILRASSQNPRQERKHSRDGFSADRHYVAFSRGKKSRSRMRDVRPGEPGDAERGYPRADQAEAAGADRAKFFKHYELSLCQDSGATDPRGGSQGEAGIWRCVR